MLHKYHVLKSKWLWVVLIALLLSLPAASLLGATPGSPNTPGDLDTTFAGFSGDGKVSSYSYKSNDMALQPDGKIVVVGYETYGSLVVQRYLPDGSLDSTFFGDGIVDFSHPQFTLQVEGVAIQADRKIVVVGSAYPLDGGDRDSFVMRIDPAIGLDPTFGFSGFVTTDFADENDYAYAVLVQPDGKIIAGGTAHDGNDYDFAVARYNTNGTLDATFDGDGRVTLDFDGEVDSAYDMVLQPDGRLIVAGESWIGNNRDFSLTRFHPNGVRDQTFGNFGRLTTGFGGSEGVMAVALVNNYIVAVGQDLALNGNTTFVARYMPWGVLDETFGSGGKLTLPNDILDDLAVQPDGKILLAGHGSDELIVFHRLLPGGAHDPTFGDGGDGIIRHDISSHKIFDMAIALQPDGRILASTQIAGSASMLMRLWPDGTTFDSGGQQTHGIAFPHNYQAGWRESANSMALQPDGAMLVAGQLYAPDYAFSDAFVSRFTADGLIDPSFGTNGSANIIGPGLFNRANAVAVQPDGKIVIAGYSAFNPEHTIMDFLVARFHPNGTPDTTFGFNGKIVLNFPAHGHDAGTGLALTPDGKVIVAGTVWTGATEAWGVARLTAAGQLDPTFGIGGFVVNMSGNDAKAGAVALQPDGKIVMGGQYNGDFLVQRLFDNGSVDGSFGASGGYTLTDLGGNEAIGDIEIAADGWIYASGNRFMNGNTDMAVAQFTPDGLLATCPDPANCQNWPTGTFFVDSGGNDQATALDLRSDNQLVVAGCFGALFGGAQVRTDGAPVPFFFGADFIGAEECASGVSFTGTNTVVMVGRQNLSPFSSDWNIALARFETTNQDGPPPPTPPPPTPPPSTPPPPTPTPGPQPAGYQNFLPITLN